MLGAANGGLIAAAIPGARLDVLDGVGHVFWWEQPQRSADLITAHALGAAAALLVQARRPAGGGRRARAGGSTPRPSSTPTTTAAQVVLVRRRRPGSPRAARRAHARSRRRPARARRRPRRPSPASSRRSRAARPSAWNAPRTRPSISSASAPSPRRRSSSARAIDGVGAAGLELQRAAQRRLVAAVTSPSASLGTRLGEEALGHRRRPSAPTNSSTTWPSFERLDGRDALDPEALARSRGFASVSTFASTTCPRARAACFSRPASAGGTARTTAPRSRRRRGLV